MPFPGGTFIDFVRGLSGYVADEFEHLYGQFEGYLRKEHKHDGTHASITADDVTIAASEESGATGVLTADGIITADADGTNPVRIGPVGVEGSSGIDIGGDWHLVTTPSTSPGGGGDHELQFWELVNSTGTAAFRIAYVSADTAYRLMPAGTNFFQLGDSSRRILALHADEVYERARNTANGIAISHSPTFAASAGNWTGVSSTCYYGYVSGRRVQIDFEFDGGTLSGAPASITATLPVSGAQIARTLVQIENAGTFYEGMARVSPSVSTGSVITFFRDTAATAFSAGSITVRGQLSYFI